MTHLPYFRLMNSFLGNFSGKFDSFYVEILNRIQVQGLIPVKASQFVTGISIA